MEQQNRVWLGQIFVRISDKSEDNAREVLRCIEEYVDDLSSPTMEIGEFEVLLGDVEEQTEGEEKAGFLPEPINLRETFDGPDPYSWDFEEERPTFLQMDERFADRKAKWYLTKDGSDDPSYWWALEPSAEGILHALHHISMKDTVNKGQLLEALLPAIDAILYPKEAKGEGQ